MPPAPLISTDFRVFGPDHLGALLAIGVFAAGISLWLRRLTHAGRHAAHRRALTCGLLAGGLLLNAIVAEIWEIRSGVWDLRSSAPLHLCDFALFVTITVFVRTAYTSRSATNRAPLDQWLYELTWFWAIAGTVQALLTPEIDDRFPQPRFIFFFVMHGGIVAGALILTFGLGFRPARGAVWRAWLVTNILAVLVLGLNGLIGANYMYLCGPPANPSLYDHFGPWPWSLLMLEAIGTLLFIVCYCPFWLANRLRDAQTHTQPATGAFDGN